MTLPRISVVIPTHNRPDRLPQTLAGLARQTIPVEDYEIVVVDDASSPPVILPLAPPQPRQRLVRLDGAERSAARNAGAAAASGELLVFLDDDILVPDHYLAVLEEAHRKWPDALLVGDIRLPPAATPFARFRQRMENSGIPGQSGVTSTPNFCAAGNMAIGREQFVAVGGFDSGLVSGEDQDLGLRHSAAGGCIAFVSEASVVHHDKALDAPSYFRRAEWGSEALIPFCTRYPDLAANRERYRINGPFSWKQDGLIGGLRKAAKGVAAWHPVTWGLLAAGAALERIIPLRPLLDRYYRTALGVHIFRGFRRGLKRFGQGQRAR
jgi:glycosyltransferase involved in cell wall biosynthesis